MSNNFKYNFVNSVKGKPFYSIVNNEVYNEPEEASGDSKGSHYYVGDIENNDVEILWNVGFRLGRTIYPLDEVYHFFMNGNWVLVEQDLDNLFQDLH